MAENDPKRLALEIEKRALIIQPPQQATSEYIKELLTKEPKVQDVPQESKRRGRPKGSSNKTKATPAETVEITYNLRNKKK